MNKHVAHKQKLQTVVTGHGQHVQKAVEIVELNTNIEHVI